MIAPSALRALAQQATPGPWEPREVQPWHATDVLQALRARDGGQLVICEHAGTDAAFIAACDPQTILALLDAVEAARPFGFDPDGDITQYPTREQILALRAALAPFTETQT